MILKVVQKRQETTSSIKKSTNFRIFNVTPYMFLPTLYIDTDMSIFGMVIVLAFQICIL